VLGDLGDCQGIALMLLRFGVVFITMFADLGGC